LTICAKGRPRWIHRADDDDYAVLQQAAINLVTWSDKVTAKAVGEALGLTCPANSLPTADERQPNPPAGQAA